MMRGCLAIGLIWLLSTTGCFGAKTSPLDQVVFHHRSNYVTCVVRDQVIAVVHFVHAVEHLGVKPPDPQLNGSTVVLDLKVRFNSMSGSPCDAKFEVDPEKSASLSLAFESGKKMKIEFPLGKTTAVKVRGTEEMAPLATAPAVASANLDGRRIEHVEPFVDQTVKEGSVGDNPAP